MEPFDSESGFDTDSFLSSTIMAMQAIETNVPLGRSHWHPGNPAAAAAAAASSASGDNGQSTSEVEDYNVPAALLYSSSFSWGINRQRRYCLLCPTCTSIY